MVHPGSGAIRLNRIIHEVSAAAAEMDIDSRFQIPDVVFPDDLRCFLVLTKLTLAQIGDPRACLESGIWNLESVIYPSAPPRDEPS